MKFEGFCQDCKKSICKEHSYIYIDENNKSITKNSPYLCKECYEKRYNEHIYTDGERYKFSLINILENLKYKDKIEVIEIDVLINYLKSQ